MIDLQLLGGLEILSPELPASARGRRRHPMMLLALVAAAAPQATSRERIMAFLWPESDATRASNSLRQAIHALRRDLGEGLFLPETSAGIQLDPEAVSVDLWRFRDAIAKQAFDEAVAAHRGPFLDGFQMAGVADVSRWVEAERSAVEREFIGALDALARDAEEAGRFDDAVAWRRRQAATDPYSSRAALGLLRALAAAGDRPGALAYAGVYENFVRTHLEVAPDPAVSEFVAGIRRATPPDRSAPMASAALRAPGDTAPDGVQVLPGSPGSAGRAVRRPSFARAPRWMIAAGVAAVGLVGIGAGYSMSVRGDTPLITLGSGTTVVDGRDTSNYLVACDGPGCPAGDLPQAAWIVPTHIAYTTPPASTHFIAPVADGTTIGGKGYDCCSTAVFETRFVLPPDAGTATISITVLADNQARVSINGLEFGRQADSLSQNNFGGPPATFATTFLPDPTGTNRLRLTLWDGGGVGGLNYRAFVTYDQKRSAEAGQP